MRILLGLGITTAIAIAACSSSNDDGTTPPGGSSGDTPPVVVAPPGTVTFHKDVEPVLQKVCQNCHVAGGIAPFSLVTYADAKGVAESIVQQTHDKKMPPWGAQNTAECTPPKGWKDDLRLSDAEVAILKAWHDAGDYEGDPKDAPPPRTAAPSAGLEGGTSLAPARRSPSAARPTRSAASCSTRRSRRPST